VLNLLGVHLGAEDDLLPANKHNARGFWENKEIYRVSEQVLEALGGDWYRPPELTPGWAHDERLEELRGRATDVIEDLSVSRHRWGFKDNRTIVLLPFWRRIIGDMDYVICVRRPQAVVRSVQNTGLPWVEPHATAKLWMDLNAAALAQTVGERRTFVFYEAWFDNPRAVARRLATFIHGEASTVSSETLDAISAFFDRKLRRADTEGEGAALAFAPELEAMYAHLRLVAAQDSDDRKTREHHALIAQTLADGYRVRQALQDDLNQAEELTVSSRAENEVARGHAAVLEQTVQGLNDEVCRRDEDLDKLRRWLDAVHASASWRITAPLRATKHGMRRMRSARRGSGILASDQSLLAGRSVSQVWWFALILSSIIAATDAVLSHVVLIALLAVGPFCGLLTGRRARTATAGIWAVVLAVLLGLPDEIWDTGTQLLDVGTVVAVALLCTFAATVIERRRYSPDAMITRLR